MNQCSAIGVQSNTDFEQLLVTGSRDTNVKLWDTRNKKCTGTFKGHEEIVTGVDISPDNQYVASSSLDGTVKIWDVVASKCIKTFNASSTLGVKAVWFNPAQYCVAAACGDRRIRYYDLNTFELINATAKDSNPFYRICFKDDGSCLYAANTDNMKVYDLENNCVLDIVMKPHRKILDLKYGEDSIFVADHTNKSVIVSGVEEKLINYDSDVVVSKTIASNDPSPFKQSFFQKGQNNDPVESYGGSSQNQSTAHFGRKPSRNGRSKKSILISSGLNMIK